MNNNNNHLTILYVDDESQALKYFARAYEDDFHIHTCESAKDALNYLTEHGDDVGVLISDQRMPNQTGVSLLEMVRKRYPHIVRILTTAYAELDNAIDAVNEGAVFRYVTKPWNINELKSVLKNAMDFAIVREERDQLLHEKLSTIQRILIMERSRYLAVIASSMSNTLNSTSEAVRDYVRLSDMTCEDILKVSEMQNIDLSLYGPEETRKMSELASCTAQYAKIRQPQVADVNLTEVVQLAIQETELEIPLDIQATDLMIPADTELIKFALNAFISQSACK
ncbi:MAG: hypothetical protein CMJ19_01640, partial [Phycisphaeraceae bacterium]|nr:hypothetical protein [Phycisphaeraceae bacterium]